MYDKLYPQVQEGQEESKEEAPKKKKKSVKIEEEKKLRVIKLKRGGKKIITEILGFELFGCDLANVAKLMGKKLGTGAAATTINFRGLVQDGI